MTREQALNTIFHLTPPGNRSVSSHGNRWVKFDGKEWVSIEEFDDEQIRDCLPEHRRAEYTGDKS